ncbi:MAG: YbfB/YjiJ family MFS transporter [Marmoricola sp.]
MRSSVPIAWGLALGPAVGLGLARFAYGLLLPPMRADLGWSFAQAGTLNTLNAAGYLAGALATGPLVRDRGRSFTFALGLVATTLAVLGEGLTAAFAVQLLLRLVAGVGAAFSFIAGAGIVAGLPRREHGPGLLLNIYTAGGGVGIVVSGVVVQSALHSGGWREGWLGLGALAALGSALALAAVRRTGASGRAQPEARGRIGTLRLPAVGYFLFGCGYIAYVTFVVAYLGEAGLSATQVTVFWTLLGVCVLLGVPLWGRLLDRMRSGHCLALITAVLCIGAALPLLVHGLAGGLASAVVFGASFLSLPAGMAHLARQRLPAPAWTSTIAQLTVAFGVGQCLGPVLAGVLADRSGGPGLGLALAAVVLGAAAVTYLIGDRAGGGVTGPGRR